MTNVANPTGQFNCPATDKRQRRIIPSYATRRIASRYGLPRYTAAEIAHPAGFPQFGEGR